MSRAAKIIFLFVLLALLGRGDDTLALDGGSSGILSPVDGNTGTVLMPPSTSSTITTARSTYYDTTTKLMRWGDGTLGRYMEWFGKYNIRNYGVDCTGEATDNTALQDALTAAAGATLFIPSGCLVSIASTTTGITVPANTQIACEDQTAGFQADRKRCDSSGTEESQSGWYAGAHCTTSSDCLDGSTCIGSQFAPTGGTNYIMLVAGGSGISIENCLFKGNQFDEFGSCECNESDCTGGNDNVNKGRACKQLCVGGSNDGRGCTSDAGCTGGSCVGEADCSGATNGASTDCGLLLAPGNPAGVGKIQAFDGAGYAYHALRNIRLLDFKFADPVVKVTASYVHNVDFRPAGTAKARSTLLTTTAFVKGPTQMANLIDIGTQSLVTDMYGYVGTLGLFLKGTTYNQIQGVSLQETIYGQASLNGMNLTDYNKVSNTTLVVAQGGTGSYGLTLGDYNWIDNVRISGGSNGPETGIILDDNNSIVGSSIASILDGITSSTWKANDQGTTLQLKTSAISGYKRTGLRLGDYSNVTGCTFAGAAGNTNLRPTGSNDLTIGIEVWGTQNLVTGCTFGSNFTHIRGVNQAYSYNFLASGNRFLGGRGPAVVPSGAGWHMGHNYFNIGATGFCSNSSATNFGAACTCTTKQCSAGDSNKLGKNCPTAGADSTNCGTGGTCTSIDTDASDGAADNPYGKYGSTADTCLATGLNSGGTCDTDVTKAQCTVTPLIQYGVSQTNSWDLLGSRGGRQAPIGHSITEANILAHGGDGAAQIGFYEGKVCSGGYTVTCKGTGGNAGSACTTDSDCTSTGCLWGDGYCCPIVGKLCTTATDCASSGATCDYPSTAISPTFGEVSLQNNYHWTDWAAIDLSKLTTGSVVKDITIQGNFGDTVKNGIKWPATASIVSLASVGPNNLSPKITGTQNVNWDPSMGVKDQSISGASEDQSRVVFMTNSSGATIDQWQAVEADSSANTVKKATTSTLKFVGINTASCATGTVCRIAVPGSLTTCKVTSSPAIQDALAVDSATAGNLKTAGSADQQVAIAVGSVSGGYQRCFLRVAPASAAVTSHQGSALAGIQSFGTTNADRWALFFASGAPSTTAISSLAPYALHVTSMKCTQVLSTGTGGDTRAFTLQKNAADVSGCTCSTVNTDTQCSDTDCGNTAFTTSDTWAIKYTNSSTPANSGDGGCVVFYTID